MKQKEKYNVEKFKKQDENCVLKCNTELANKLQEQGIEWEWY